MANTIIMKRSAVPGKVPAVDKMQLGELAINTYDGRLFAKKEADGIASIVEIGGVTTVNGLTGDAVVGTDEVAEGSSNLYFTTSRARSAISAGVGITYSSGTGVISTAQNLSTAGSPTFAGLTLSGNMGITGNIVPSADNVYSLGSIDKVWKDVYVGPGTLYVNGSPVITDNSGTMTFTADTDQNIRLTTVGAGVLQLGSSSTNVSVDGTLQIANGKNITDSAGVAVSFGDNIQMNSNKVVGLGAPSASTDAATKGYVDTAIGAVSTSSIEQGNSSVSVVDTGSGVVTVTVDGSTALTVSSTGVVVAGNFTVSGTTTTVESNTVAVADNIITLNSDTTGAATQNAGVEIERGDDANVSIRWNEGSDVWQFTNDGASYTQIATSTDTLAEGSTNLYHTAGRARAALSASTASGISYNSTSGLFTLGSIPNSSLSNNSVSFNGVSVSLGGSGTLDTDDVSEGSTNQYFTNTRARGAVSAVGDLTYNSSTGVFSFTKPSPVVTVTMTGDVTGSASATLTSLASGTVSIATTIAANSVALGTDTTGNYAASVAAGSGITVSGSAGEGTTFTVAHADTSAQANVTASGRTYVTGLTFDTYGHVTGVTTGTETVVDTNTTYSAGGGLTLTGTTFSLTDISSQASLTALTGANVISDIDVDAYGRVTLLATRTMTLGDLGYTGATNANYITNTNQLTNGAGFVTSSGVTSVATGNGLTGGTITSTGTLSLSGSYSGNWTVTGEVTAYASDARLKTNVVAIESPLAKLEAIRGVTYNWNEKGQELGLGTEQQVGVIAQEIEAVLPQLVVESAHEGFKTVKYDKLTALLIEAVKELSSKVASLEAQLAGK
jgi:hypothetical protein